MDSMTGCSGITIKNALLTSVEAPMFQGHNVQRAQVGNPKMHSSPVKRSSLAIVVTIALTLTYFSTTTFASARAYGPPNAIKTLRVDVPVLLADSLRGGHPVQIDMIYTDGKKAVTTWSSGLARGLAVLRFDGKKWWWIAGAATVNEKSGYWTPLSFPGREVTYCAASLSHSPTVAEILASGVISSSFAARLAPHLRILHTTARKGQPIASCDPGLGQTVADGYQATWLSPFPAGDVAFSGGAPSNGALPAVCFVFSLSTDSASPISIADGAILRVWFPFVLNPQRSYVLIIDSQNGTSGGPLGVLSNNTLTFSLPALTIRSSEPIQGKVAQSQDAIP